ncbi:MAG: pilus assembly protein PilC, partial [Gammaproteobacteria bacterium]|nr:pilus assembly protein PilC [Gammaproteobacteria bacterium]
IFRDRTYLIGDLVNSTPVTSSTENFFYEDLPGGEGSSYASYLASKITKFKSGSNFFNIVYVGSNDGMLHAFQDTYDTAPSDAGKEIFSYIPSHIHPKLENLTKPNYNHEYFVNATPHVADAYISSAWRTMLVGAFGAGAKGLYALNITDPKNFAVSDVMWEFKEDSDVTNGSGEIGYVLTSPQVVRLKNNKWGVVFGNGYNSTSQQARLFILDAADGSIMKVINTGVGSFASPNGLSEPILVDVDLDGIVDRAYAGDLHGKMWKFDLSSASASNWKVAFDSVGDGSGTPIPLFSATDANGVQQTITSRPSIAYNPDGGFNVIFGTGKYLEIGDNIIPGNPAQNSVYSVNDNNAAITSGRSALVQQEILAEQDEYDDNGTPADTSDDVLTNRVRITSSNTVNYASKNGWFMDLLAPDGPDTGSDPDPYGERVIARPLTRFGRAIFTTYTPSASPCDGGGISLLMDLDALSGARLGESVFDVNGDGFIDANDLVLYNSTGTVASGIFITGTLGPPAIISASGGTSEYRIISGIDGTIQNVEVSVDPRSIGRQSWRQLQ